MKFTSTRYVLPGVINLKWMKHRVILLLLMMATFLSGCVMENIGDVGTVATDTVSTTKESIDPIERDVILRVATIPEHITTKPLNDQISNWIWYFEKEHPNVDVVLEDISATERMQTELMAGRGPDVLLLPSSAEWNIMTDVTSFPVLIQDVNQAMRNGIFYDISEFYEADTDLGKEALAETVMDAGVVDNARYVLPLRYNLQVTYVNMDAFRATGLSTELFEKDIVSFWNALVECGNSSVISSAIFRTALNNELKRFGNLIDYENQEVLLTQEELVNYYRAFMEFEIAKGDSSQLSAFPVMKNYIAVKSGEDAGLSMPWIAAGNCMFAGDLDYVLHNAVIAKAERVDLEMFPLKATDGSVIADITFYGAVSAGSENPDLSYEFLRYFLTEDAQWEQSVYSENTWGKLIGDGWPVRTLGSVSQLSKRFNLQISRISSFYSENNGDAREFTFSDEDVPILSTKIDKARFPTGLETKFSETNIKINVAVMKNSKDEARNMNLDEMAEEFIQELEWHVGEG